MYRDFQRHRFPVCAVYSSTFNSHVHEVLDIQACPLKDGGSAACVTFAKMEVISAIGFSLATLREVCRLCSAVDGDKDAAWIESTTVVMDDNKELILVSNEQIQFVLLLSQDMKHTSLATFSHGVVLSINESTSCRKSSMRK